jgi:hypothetical protein
MTNNFQLKSRIFAFLPEQVKNSLQTYAESAGVPVFAVITFAFSTTLCLDPVLADGPAETEDELDPLAELPEGLQTALRQYLQEDPEMPVEFLVELAIAHFLDPDCNTFNDCVIWPQREQLELFKEAVAQRSILAA